MRRLFTILTALLVASPAFAQQRSRVEYPILQFYDLDTPTEAADDDQVVASVNLTNTTFTLAAQPDTPRNLTVIVTDTTDSINAGTITVTGTDVNGAAQSWVIDVSAHAGGAVTYTGTQIFKTVTSVVAATVGVLGGGGDELIKVGTGSLVAPIYCKMSALGDGPYWIETSGSSTTTTGVSSAAAFADLAVGDTIIANGLIRKIASRTSASEITVDTAWDLSRTYPFQSRKQLCGYSDSDGWVYIPGPATLDVSILQGSATGGVTYFIEGMHQNYPVLLATGNFSAVRVIGQPSANDSDAFALSDVERQYRFGFKFGTNDDGTDTSTLAEKIIATVVVEELR